MYGIGPALYRPGILAPKALRALPPWPLYVDAAEGSDAADGKIDTPLQTITAAMALCAGLDDWVIRVKTPDDAIIRADFAYNSSANLIIEGWDDEPWTLYGSEQYTGWTNTSGNIWRRAATLGTEPLFVVNEITETLGDRDWPYRLRPNLTTPTAPDPGQCGRSGGYDYVHMPDGSDPNGLTIEAAVRSFGFNTYGFGRLTIRDMICRHYIVAGAMNGLSTALPGAGNMTVEDSLIEYCGAAGVGATGNNEETVCLRTKCYRSVNDGYGLHKPIGWLPPYDELPWPAPGAGRMILNDCEGSYCGDEAGLSSQGASPHEDCHLIINGGTYRYNVSGIVAINDAVMDIHGNTAHGAVTVSDNMRLGNTPGTIAAHAAIAWLDTSTGTVSGAINVTNNQGVGVRVNTPGAVDGVETINSSDNALPDEIAA